MLGVVPVVGGLFTSDDDQPGRDHVAILSERLWTRRYGRDPSIVGKNIQINLETYRVAGVIRPILDYRVAADLWMPLAFAPSETAPGTRSPHNIDVIGRLKPGGSIQEARDEFRRIAAFIVEQYPNQASMDRGFSLDLEPLAEKQAGDLKTPLLVLIVAVGALMLIACANVSNLLLARAMKRRREIGIRSSLGASRLRLIRQLLTESLLLASIAGGAGTLLALYGLRLYAQFGPADLIHGARPSINAWVMGFSLFVSIAASMLFGIAPALETSRIDLTEALKEGSRGSTGGRKLLRGSMVAFEVCASLVLLIGAGLLVKSFVRLEHTSPGFQSEKVLTAVVSLPVAQYREPWQRAAFARLVLERVRGVSTSQNPWRTMAARAAAESRSWAIREIQMNRGRSSGKRALRPVSSRLSESRSCAAATSPLPTSRVRPALPSSMRSPLRNCSQTPTRSACKSLSR